MALSSSASSGCLTSHCTELSLQHVSAFRWMTIEYATCFQNTTYRQIMLHPERFLPIFAGIAL
jgi:hypothetical protein